MIRAGVFIGVDKTGGLQRLNDAARGAARMHEWAVKQGIPDGTHAKLITDAAGKVTPDQIFDAIKTLTQGAGVDQLLVYFAGHGVNISRHEHWLLSDAPGNPSAAIDVSASMEFAKFGEFQHVVIVSDACRVAPEGIAAQSVQGVSVFENLEPVVPKAKPVDQFLACALGRTAAEVKDPGTAAGNFSALYTTAMLEALGGARADVLDPGDDPADGFRYLRPDRLKDYLETELPRRIRALNLTTTVNQEPDAIIVSRNSWLSRVEPAGAGQPTPSPTTAAESDGPDVGPPPLSQPPSSLGRLVENMTRSAVETGAATLTPYVEWAHSATAPEAEALVHTAEAIAAPFGPDHFETESGIKVRGARIDAAFTARAELEPLGDTLLRIHHIDSPAVSVLVIFDGGNGTVVPCLPGFIAGLTLQDGELVDVSYEPSANTWRWGLYESSAADLRALRGVAAASAYHGRFRLAADDAGTLARKMQYAKMVDPTMAVYAAYAYHDLQTVDHIEEMSFHLGESLGVSLFDVELLARKLAGRRLTVADPVVPFVPLLSQGWPLLGPLRITLHPALTGIQRTLQDSLWSMFDKAGVRMLRNALQSGEVR